ncbi:MAG: hypothetical protein COB69_07740 [Phycisphaera sp.]|nr:MAG: hypothetical protein COB69_07740 [Phycisphaera sp.]
MADSNASCNRNSGLGCFGVIILVAAFYFLGRANTNTLREQITTLETKVDQLQTDVTDARKSLRLISLEVGSVVELGEPAGTP